MLNVSSTEEQKYSGGNTGTSVPLPSTRPSRTTKVLANGQKARQWCVTFYEKPKFDETWMKYLLIGEEICPTTGRIHWQGHVSSINPLTLANAKKKVSPWHVEASVAPMASIKYCKEDGKWEEFGIPPNQGARSDITELVKRIRDREITVDEVVMDDPEMFHKYGRTLQAASEIGNRQKRRCWAPEVYWIWGPTGTGKTRFAWEKEPNLWAYPYENNQWWDTYQGQEAILFDDFRGQVQLNMMLRICDRYAMDVPQRGKAPYPLLAKRIYITSCKPPQECYSVETSSGDNVSQLLRRITKLIVMDGIPERISGIIHDN